MSTVEPPSSVTLRWRPIGLTLAGLTGSRGLNASQLNRPIDLALTSSNTLYIADFDNNRVQKWLAGASSGVTVAGQANGAAASTAAYLFEPTALYIDANENIYVSDGGNDRVQLWTKGATVGTRVAGTGEENRSKERSYDSHTYVVFIAGSPGFAINQLSLPYGVIQDPITKTLYIGDYENHRVMSYASGASTGTVAAGGHGLGFNPTQLNYPVGIDFDSFTNSLFIANFAANNIVRWQLGASSWTLVAGNQTGSSSNTSTMLSLCTGVTLDSLGNVYVADTGNHRIQFFPAGQSEGRTIAGITGVPGTNSTQLTSPYTARLDSQLNLYVADTGGHRIQKFERY